MPTPPRTEESIFAEALERATPHERAAFLDEACGQDAVLRAQVEKLLKSHEEGGSFLHKPPVATVDEPVVSERPGMLIGPYKLKEQIGEGGMGLVFVAEQQQPVRRKVALKIIKPGMDTREVIARFEAERQALALMDHPNIARVLDAGATESGRPFFVMELVKGIPIVEYCDQQQLTARERLELFLSVCQAVQHAHSKGIIHRDLKPSNILVAPHDGVPVVKVIDFGVAKAIGQQLTDKSIYTRFTQMIGTPLYMSPEQAEINALDVDIRSDVYSLGVLLYELLTGSTPFDKQRFATAAYDEIRRIIKEEEPPKPSTRLSSLGATLTKVSTKRKTEPAKLAALVKGDLDWIVMKALEKDRNRRYETASAFAADVRRFLSEDPIEARPPSAWYRFHKMARRNKAALTTSAVIAAILLLGTAVSAWQAVRATNAEAAARRAEGTAADGRDKALKAESAAKEQRDKAIAAETASKKAVARADAINHFLLTDMLAPDEPLGRNTKVEQMLRNAAAKVDKAFPDQPEVEAAIRNAIGEAYHTLGYHKEAQTQLDSALKIRSDILGPEHADTLATMISLARLYHAKDDRTKSIDLARKVLDIRLRDLPKDHEDTLNSMQHLAYFLTWARGTREAATHEADILVRKALQASRATLRKDHKLTTMLMSTQTAVFLRQNKLDEAVTSDREVLATRLRVLGEEHPDTLVAMQNLSLILGLQANRTQREESRQSLLKEAEMLAHKTLKNSRKVRGDEHPSTLGSMNRLVGFLLRRSELAEAEKLAREALPILRRDLGEQHFLTLNAIRNLGEVLHRQGKLAEAEPLLKELVEIRRKLGKEGRPSLDSAIRSLASLLRDKGELKEAEQLYRELLALADKDADVDDRFTAALGRADLSHMLLMKKKDKEKNCQEAVLLLRDSKKHAEVLFPSHWRYFDIQSMLGAALAGTNKDDPEAEPLLLKGYEGLKERQAAIDSNRQYVLTDALERLVRFYDATGNPNEAAMWRKKLAARKAAEDK